MGCYSFVPLCHQNINFHVITAHNVFAKKKSLKRWKITLCFLCLNEAGHQIMSFYHIMTCYMVIHIITEKFKTVICQTTCQQGRKKNNTVEMSRRLNWASNLSATSSLGTKLRHEPMKDFLQVFRFWQRKPETR